MQVSQESKNGTKKPDEFSHHLFGEFKQIETEYECEFHGTVKTTALLKDGQIFSITCPLCEQERLLAEEIEATKRKRLAKIESYKKSNIEPEYWDKTLDDFKPQTDKQKEMLESTRRLIEVKKGKLVLTGPNGVGKTHMGAMAVKALGGRIYSMYEISTMIRQSYSLQAEKSELQIVNELAEAPMLVIDEIGRSSGSAAEMNWLSFLIDKRHVRGLPLMILSNRHLKRECPSGGCGDCFERNFNNDVLSRIRDGGKIITIEKNAPDWRARRKDGDGR